MSEPVSKREPGRVLRKERIFARDASGSVGVKWPNVRWTCSLKPGTDEALSERYCSIRSVLEAPPALVGKRAAIDDVAEAYSESERVTLLLSRSSCSEEIIAGMNVSRIDRSVVHCSGVRMSAGGGGGSGAMRETAMRIPWEVISAITNAFGV